MRCYFMRSGHIAAVEFLVPGPDASLIDQAKEHFRQRSAEQLDGFEVWDRARRVYVHDVRFGGDDAPQSVDDDQQSGPVVT